MQLLAQDPNNLAVDGTIKDENGGRITGAVIILIQDGQELKRVQTGKNGRFDLYLDFGHEFLIEITKATYVAKKLYINTNNVPDDEQAWGYEFGGFVVDMFKRMDGVDYSVLENPIGKVYYEPNVENFVDDRVYTRQIKQEIDRLEDAQKERVKQEEERLRRIEEDFDLAIKDAQQAISDGDYLLGKDNALAAQSMKPDSEIPKQLLREVEARLADSGAKDDTYQSILASADQSFGNNSFNEAIGYYNQALGVKPDETYPKQRIEESRKRLEEEQNANAQESALAAKEKQYANLITQADGAFDQDKFRDARTYYQRALELKQEEHPKRRLAQIDQKISDAAKAQEVALSQAVIDAQYADKIDKADATFKAGNLEMARSHYQSASDLKTQERYPKDQMAAIDQRLKDLALQREQRDDAKALDEQYASLIQSGERYYNGGDLESSLGRFKEAAEVKPTEVYAKAQVEKIQGELDKMSQIALEQERLKEAERSYLTKVEEANKLFNSGKFKEARPVYQEAQALQPDEKHPATQISRIDSELERQARERDKDATYMAGIEQADQLFEQGKWSEAINVYQNASGVKPGEPYPKIKIGEAQKYIDQENLAASEKRAKEEKEAGFRAMVDAGDKAYGSGDLKGAVNKYDQALRIRADEYARGQVEKIAKELDRIEQEDKQASLQAEIDKQYNDAIARGDLQFDLANFEEAKTSYNVAMGYKAEEEYPKRRLAEVEVKLAEVAEQKRLEALLKAKRSNYEDLLKLGNEQIANREYDQAKNNFTEALSLYPEEEIPQRKLTLIEDLIVRERIAQIQQAYQEALSKADRAFASKEYEAAIPMYEAAQKVKPDENYPRERIKKINEIITDLANRARQAEEDNRKRVIEETFDEGRTKVTIRRVSMDGKEDVYKRVVHAWGGIYYFLNEMPITELVWSRETAK
ncbi:MAG: hypothetical protein HQ500_05405 [Flavobacteriales bacterium]|nr:hypothetical protein [Flavobacteriales bacterium]